MTAETFAGWKGLARQRRDLTQADFRREIALDLLAAAIYRQGVPDSGEDLEEFDLYVTGRADGLGLADKRFESGRHIGVAGHLTACQGACVAAKIW